MDKDKHAYDHLYWEYAPTLIVDAQRREEAEEIFAKPAPTAVQAKIGSLFLQQDASYLQVYDGSDSSPVYGSSLVYKTSDGRSVPIYNIISDLYNENKKEQFIAAADLITSRNDTVYVAYVISQDPRRSQDTRGGQDKLRPGWFTHALNVVRLDPWLLRQKDTDRLLQNPIVQIPFSGPRITKIRFGSGNFDGSVLLESAPSSSFFEVVWSLGKLRQMVCDTYDHLPSDDKDSIRDGATPLSPTYLETVGRSLPAGADPCQKP